MAPTFYDYGWVRMEPVFSFGLSGARQANRCPRACMHVCMWWFLTAKTNVQTRVNTLERAYVSFRRANKLIGACT